MKILITLILLYLSYSSAYAENQFFYSSDNFKQLSTVLLLNKVTGQSKIIYLKINSPLLYDNLEFTMLKCWQNPMDEHKDNITLLKIQKKNLNTKQYHEHYYNWMFSKYPALNSFTDNVYDILSVKCSLDS